MSIIIFGFIEIYLFTKSKYDDILLIKEREVLEDVIIW